MTTLQAADLAFAYHDAMNMVNQPGNPVPGTSAPRAILVRYLQAAENCGVKLHNDAWEKHAFTVVAEIEKRRRDAARKAFA